MPLTEETIVSGHRGVRVLQAVELVSSKMENSTLSTAVRRIKESFYRAVWSETHTPCFKKDKIAN